MSRVEDQWWSYRLIPAGFGPRAVALAVDVATLVALVATFYWFFRGLDETTQRYFDPILREALPPNAMSAVVGKILGLSLLLNILYGVVGESSPWGGTLGKRIMGIHVVDEYGERISLTTSIVRNLVKIVSLGALGLGCFASLWHVAGRTWHDRAAGTFVARG